MVDGVGGDWGFKFVNDVQNGGKWGWEEGLGEKVGEKIGKDDEKFNDLKFFFNGFKF